MPEGQVAARRLSAWRGGSGMRTLRRRAALAAVPAAAWLSRLLVGTLRVRRDDSAVAALIEARAPMILVMWHARIVVLPVVYGRRVAMRALVSRSLDGELTARYLEHLGIGAVRGSSGPSGAAGLRALARVLAEGVSVIVVPDGPRGPREVLKPGVIALARRTGVPIVPVAVGALREWRLRSWDGFRIPKPFSPCVVRAGAPIAIEPGEAESPIGEADLEARRADVEEALRALTRQVDEEARR
jgi:lysophospholipid acyltransferase (LPLAT)-like uncharacterized protein